MGCTGRRRKAVAIAIWFVTARKLCDNHSFAFPRIGVNGCNIVGKHLGTVFANLHINGLAEALNGSQN
jgi:hypothetical protein